MVCKQDIFVMNF